MSKPRVVIPICIQFSTRYLVRTGLLQRMTEYAQPIVLGRWEDAELQQEVEAAGGEYHLLPRAELNTGYTRIKRQQDILHLKRVDSPTTAIDNRRNTLVSGKNLRQRSRNTLYGINVALPGKSEQLQRKMAEAIWKHTNIHVFDDLLKTLKADAVFSLTPFFQHEQLLLYAASRQGMPLFTSILSFDNLTTRGLIPVIFDAYFVWNRYNEAELRRIYPEANDRLTVIVGPPQFDFYSDPSYIWDEKTWRARLGLPADRPIILFGAGYYTIVPNEHDWLQQLDDAIEAKRIPGDPVILFRRHPNDPLERWRPVLNGAKHIVRDDPWSLGQQDLALTSIRREDIEKLASTLAHSQVHINASSTMTIDGAIFNRPQIGQAYDDNPRQKYDRVVKELYLREHYLPITNSGGLTITESREDTFEAVRNALSDPSKLSRERKQLVEDLCTFSDGMCTERVNQALKSCLSAVSITD